MIELNLAQKVAIWVIPVLFAITVHEVAHGWVASLFGDQTARLSGRLTLNPIKHIDLVGTIIVPLVLLVISNFIFGWAKPVPVDERNLRNPRRDMAIVALAGPVANFVMAILWGLIAKCGLLLLPEYTSIGVPLVYMGKAGIMINVVLGVLNCVPLPPLDGGRVLMSVLPRQAAYHLTRLEPYMFFIIALLMVSGVLSQIISPPIMFLIRAISQIVDLPVVG